MLPYPGGSSMSGGSGSMNGGNQGLPQGSEPPQPPQSPSGSIYTYDKPNSDEEKEGYSKGTFRRFKDFEIYEHI